MDARPPGGRGLLIVGIVLMALGVVGLVALLVGWRPGVEPWCGDLLETSVSPDGRWEAQAYELNPGAMASERMRVQVRDLSTPGADATTVYLEYGLGELSWDGPGTLVVTSYSEGDGRVEIDVASAEEVHVGPDPETADSPLELVWLIVFGPLSVLLALLGALLAVAGVSVRAQRKLFGPRGT